MTVNWQAIFGVRSIPGPAVSLLRIFVTCERCGQRHEVEKRKAVGERFWLVCAACEVSLDVLVEDHPMRRAGA